jgi:Skp family chaperone for outer membrane proteins
MNKKIFFDTLAHAKILKKKGVSHADAHAGTLADSLSKNIYMKIEVDKLIEDTFRKFDERTAKMCKEFDERTAQTRIEFDERTAQTRTELEAKKEVWRKEFEAKQEVWRKELELKEKESAERVHKIELDLKDSTNKAVQRITISLGIICTLLTIVGSLLHTWIH